jgi:sugar/nucleoside kinase (ribokinase family)
VKRLLDLAQARYEALIGVGGIGAGILFALDGNQDLGRNESRGGRLLESRDYCKLHIISHFTAVFTGATPAGRPFHVLPIGKVGRDAAGDRLLAEMRDAGLDCRFVEAVPDLPTLFAVCYQFPDGAGGNLTPTNAAPCRLAEADLDAAQPWLERYGARAIALAAPEVPLAMRASLLRRATVTGAFRVASFVPGEMADALKTGLLEKVDLLAINEDEAVALTGSDYSPANPEPLLQACADYARRRKPALKILLSVGAGGVYGYESGRWAHRAALAVKPVSTAGAGDTLLGGVLSALAAGWPFLPDESDSPKGVRSALAFGNLAAGLSVLSPHTIDAGLNVESLDAGARRFGYQLD